MLQITDHGRANIAMAARTVSSLRGAGLRSVIREFILLYMKRHHPEALYTKRFSTIEAFLYFQSGIDESSRLLTTQVNILNV